MSAENEVRQASEQFYAALNRVGNGDASSMPDIWSHSATVTTMHPLGGREVGWDEVKGPWEQVAQLCSDAQFNLSDQLIQVSGDMAYEVGTEQGQCKIAGDQVTFNHRVTNIYRRENGAWKIVHHHSDVAPAMVAVLSRLQAKA